MLEYANPKRIFLHRKYSHSCRESKLNRMGECWVVGCNGRNVFFFWCSTFFSLMVAHNLKIMYLCSVIKNQLNMDNNELENEIERLKQKIADYKQLVPILQVSAEEEERQINIMLDDLSKLLEKRQKK